jgi:hypothetical protein
MPLPVVISFLRHSCPIVPQSLIPFLHSGYAQWLFPHVRPFEVPLATSLLARFFHRFFLTLSPLWPHPLHHVTLAWCIIRLQAAANFFWELPLPWVCLFGWPWRLTAIWQSLNRLFSALTIFTAASSLGISLHTTSKFCFFWICLQIRGLHLS